MNSDSYTRIVLTVIAACLVWIVARDVELVKPAYAASGLVDVNIVRIAGERLGPDFARNTVALPVAVMGGLPVRH